MSKLNLFFDIPRAVRKRDWSINFIARHMYEYPRTIPFFIKLKLRRILYSKRELSRDGFASCFNTNHFIFRTLYSINILHRLVRFGLLRGSNIEAGRGRCNTRTRWKMVQLGTDLLDVQVKFGDLGARSKKKKKRKTKWDVTILFIFAREHLSRRIINAYSIHTRYNVRVDWKT